jgi:iron complex outermembrane receptor protein
VSATPGDTVVASHPENELGIYLQDLVTLTPHLKAMAGARFDANHTEQRVEWAALGLHGVVAKQTTRHVTPRAGLVWQPNGAWSVYAGWSRSFFPNLSTPGLDPKFPPEQGEQFEGGVRFERRGFSATAAAYRITKRNTLEPIPNDSLGRSALSGEQRSRGMELDLQGSPLPGWRLIGAYAYTDATQTKSVDPTLPAGGQLAGVPRHAASLWTTYELSRGALHGLTLGAGVYAWTAHEATFPHTVRVPGWQRLDLMLAYDWRGYRLQLNADNLTDTKYFLGNYAGLARQAPRSASASITAQF